MRILSPRAFAPLAGLALAAGSLLGSLAPASAAVHAPAHRCTIRVSNTIKRGSGGWYRVTVKHSCSPDGVYAKALCKLTPTIGKDYYGPTVYGGGSSRAQCPRNRQVSAAWWVNSVTHKAVKVYP